jgi:hypothetical protein
VGLSGKERYSPHVAGEGWYMVDMRLPLVDVLHIT